MQSKWVYWLTCVLTILGIAVPSQATTIVMPTDEQLIAKSPLIVEATVVRSSPIARGDEIWTESELSVIHVYKGTLATPNVTVREIGGIVGDRITKIFGAPAYATGEHVLLFLASTPRGDYQTVDLFVGKFTEEQTLAGRRLWTRPDGTAEATLLDANFRTIESKNMQRDGAAFEQFIAERVAGRNTPAIYAVATPVLASATKTSAGSVTARAIKPDFTLISEPSVYRWFTFDSGSAAQWYSFGAQPGYSGGGVSEIQTAIAAWNGYAGAKINYVYSGSTTTSGGNAHANGVNEIVFNDPNGEISGSWNPSTGGVVGQGGFNGVAGASSWTGPFDADAAHLARNYQAWRITEGNLVIQDNVSPTNGMSSNRLAEIVAHEFGHTLGFGHSSDSTALMYYLVTGLGPALRNDDQLAARWLYPSGSVSAPPPVTVTLPAAPTNLTAQASGTSAQLAWRDNATNETGQSIYAAAGTAGAFSKVADIAAGQVAVTLTGFSAGTYRLYVVSFNSAGSSAASNIVQLTIAAPVQASFVASPLTGVAGTTAFSFADQSTGTIASRLWSFGDGATSTATAPTHVYATANQYSVTLTVTGTSGTQSQTVRNVLVTAPAAALLPSFRVTPSLPTTAQNVTFFDQSSGNVTGWHWDFGDGTSSTQQNPVKRYASAGNYLVTLTISSGTQNASTTQTVAVAAGAPAIATVAAAFATSAETNVAQPVTFTDQSSGAPTAWMWSFGDGASSSLQSPTHSYSTAGTYGVTLVASNSVSSSSITRSVTISIVIGTYHATLPVSARTAGVAATTWRTALSVFNSGAEAASVGFTFVPAAGGATVTRNITLQPKQSADYDDALDALFHLTAGSGAIEISATSAASTAELRISSRTFTSSTAGSYGQGVPAVLRDDMQQQLYMAGMESDASFRTNIGLVNGSNTPVEVTVALSDGEGNPLASTSVSMAPFLFRQAAISEWFPQLAGRSFTAVSARVTASAASSIAAYASVIDNRTQDPVLITARPRTTGSSMLIPVVGRAAGANNTFWRSDVTLMNPTSSWLAIDARFFASGSDNRAATPRTVSIPPGRTVVLSDVSTWLGVADGNGALSLSWAGTDGPTVTSRTYTARTDGGTLGQSIEPLQTLARDSYVPGLRSDATFRSNVGLVNGGDATVGVTVVLLNSLGQALATNFVQVPPRSQQQYPIASLFPSVNPSNLGTFAVQAHTETPTIAAYGSIVDNVSGDPVYFAGQ